MNPFWLSLRMTKTGRPSEGQNRGRGMVGVLTLAAGLLFSQAPGVAQPIAADPGQRTVHRVLAARSAGWVDVELLAGRLEVVGWDRDEVEIEAELGSAVDDLTTTHDGQRILVRLQIADEARVGSAAAVDLRLRLPTASKLRARLVDGSIRVEGARGSLDLETITGTVEVVDGAPREILLTTASGTVRLAAPVGRARLRTASGSVRVEGPIDDLAVVTATGDQTIVAPLVLEMRLETVAGRVTFDGTVGAKGRMLVRNHLGGTELRLADDLAAELDLRTRRGELVSAFGPLSPIASAAAGPPAGGELVFVAGSGGPRIEVESLDGDILVSRHGSPLAHPADASTK